MGQHWSFLTYSRGAVSCTLTGLPQGEVMGPCTVPSGFGGAEGVSGLHPPPACLPLPAEDSCMPPFEFQACGSPCTGLCATYLSPQLCQDLPPCQPGCYCPEVKGGARGDAAGEGVPCPLSRTSSPPLQTSRLDSASHSARRLFTHTVDSTACMAPAGGWAWVGIRVTTR